MTPSVRQIVITGVVALLTLTVGTIVGVNFLITGDTLRQQARLQMENATGETIGRIEDFLAPASNVAELTERLAEDALMKIGDPLVGERFFLDQLRLHPSFSGIHIASSTGDFVYVTRDVPDNAGAYMTKVIAHDTSARTVDLIYRDLDFTEIGRRSAPEDTFDPRTRPWYVNRFQTDRAAWTQAYRFFTSRQPGITAVRPVQDKEGRMLGTVSVDIELGRISRFLAGLMVGEHGVPFLLGRDGAVLAFPDEGRVFRTPAPTEAPLELASFTAFNDPLLSAAVASLDRPLKMLAPGERIFTEFTAGGERYLASFTVFPGGSFPWMVGIYVPEADFLGAFKGKQFYLMISAVAVGLAACGIALVFGWVVDRSLREIRASAAAVRAGQLDQISPVTSPIRELRETQQAMHDMAAGLRERDVQNQDLNRRLETFAAAVDQSPLAIFMTDSRGHIDYANASLTKMLKVPHAELMGVRFWSIGFSLPETVRPAEVLLRLRRWMVWRGEVKAASRDGQEFQASVVLTPIRGEGARMKCVGVIEDVTERKTLHTDLVAAAERATSANRAKSMFLANMSHELRTPLNAIMGFAEVIKGQYFGPVGQKSYTEYAGHIHDSGAHLLAMISDLLDISAIEVGQIHLNESHVRLSDLIDEEIRQLRSLAAARRITIGCTADTSIELMADGTKLRRAIGNLISNAVKYSPDDTRVHVMARREGTDVAIEVRDQGIGMSEEDLKVALRPFGRPRERDMVRTADGMGLGLPIAVSLVELHGGRLDIETKVGEGTLVRITLPGNRLVPGIEQPVEKPAASPAADRSGESA